MSLFRILQYEDLIWRVIDIAEARKAFLYDTGISLPVPVDGDSQVESQLPALTLFLYQIERTEKTNNPQIVTPYARVKIQGDGDLLEWSDSSGQSIQPVGRRFSELAAEMTPGEQEAFIKTYYELLISQAGPLCKSWSSVDVILKRDLRELFQAMGEPPFWPLYRQYAGDFLGLIGC